MRVCVFLFVFLCCWDLDLFTAYVASFALLVRWENVGKSSEIEILCFFFFGFYGKKSSTEFMQPVILGTLSGCVCSLGF